MKKLFGLFTIMCFLVCSNLFCKEPVVFHFNFSFEKETWKFLKEWTLTEDIENITIKIHNHKNHLLWERSFAKGDLIKDEYGYCQHSDTIKHLKNTNKPYSLNVNYVLKSGIDDSCRLFFYYPDSVNSLALELHYDQALVRWMKDDRDGVPQDEYDIDTNPKPTLIVKYLYNKQNVYMGPTWFEQGLTKRPKYILYNNSPHEIYRINNDWFTCFFGDLFILDSNNTWQSYLFAPVCGTFRCEDTLYAGQTYYIIEGYPIAREPRKLIGGYYKYSVKYKDVNDQIKTLNTFFSVIYSK